MTFSIIIAVLSIIALLVIHEFGHFIVAKIFKVKVTEFGVGLPPRLAGKKIGETLYSLNLLPFGAFVKIPDVESEEKDSSEVASWKKALILFAGSAFFWLAGFILLTIVFAGGIFQEVSDEEMAVIDPQVQITAISSNSPAEEAGLKAGDIIEKIIIQEEEFLINKVGEVQEITETYQGEEIVLAIQRGNDFFETALVSRVSPPEGDGHIGIALVRMAEKDYSFFGALIEGAKETFYLTVAIISGLFQILASLFSGQGLPQGAEFMGPVGIGSLATQAVGVGLTYFLRFIAVISIYLAIFNLLPIPALDGGRLLFLGIEKIKGSPFNQKIEQNITAGFFLLLILLIVFITISDIMKLL